MNKSRLVVIQDDFYFNLLIKLKNQPMKSIFYILIFVIVASCKKESPVPNQVKEFTIHSTAVGASYNMKVALPDNYNSSQKYATVYVLDGNDNFNFVAENCKEISRNYSTSNVLVVSIGYGRDRATDYTPTKALEGEGGAPQFMAFIQKELIPKMEADYSADTTRKSRVILGHSFGGLFASYAYGNNNEVFGNYIILSPSIWYDNEIILRIEQDNRSANNNNQQLVFMGLGEMENSGRMQAPFEAFYQRLKNNYSNIKIEKHLESHLGHVGSKNPNIKLGLCYYFQNR